MEVMLERDVEIKAHRPTDLTEPLKGAMARCLSSAFSSREWSQTPLPLGCHTDHASSRGIIAGLGSDALAVSAWVCNADDDQWELSGCALGGLLNERLIDQYGLHPYGAREGDALLAFVGIVPSVQGMRVVGSGPSRFVEAPATLDSSTGASSSSVAHELFSQWLRLPPVQDCLRVFLRTRYSIPAIQHLANRHGFEFCGQIAVDFHGVSQERLIYRRTNEPCSMER